MEKTTKLSRRDALRITAAGAVAAAFPNHILGNVVSAYPSNQWGTPGLYPARVIAVSHPRSVVAGEFQQLPIQHMIRSALTALTGATDYVQAWKRFVGPGDVVGIKINPNGNTGTRSSPAVIMEIVDGMLRAGVEPDKVFIYERYRVLLDRVSAWFRAPVRTAYTSDDYSDDQTNIAGYDSYHYVDLPIFLPWQDPKNPAHTRSYAAQFITTKVNKLINLAVLKDHNAAGVTLALKNLSHGLVNNVNRSHPETSEHRFTTYIPAVVSMPVIRYKTVLNIIDGLNGLYESGPNGDPAYNWPHKTIYFATDAVAIDSVGWRVIDEKRAQMHLPPVASARGLGGSGPIRQPQYITAAGQAGLGEWRDDHIDLRPITLT